MIGRLAFRSPKTGLLFALLILVLINGCAGESATLVPAGPGVEVSTPKLSVPEGTKWQLSARAVQVASEDVVWSVEEADGGTVTSTGVYTSPARLGRFHVRATSVSDPKLSGTIEVNVVVGGVYDGFDDGPWVGLGANAHRSGYMPDNSEFRRYQDIVREYLLGDPDDETLVSPIIVKNRIAYCVGNEDGRGYLLQFDLQRSSGEWRRATEGTIHSTPAAGASGMVYVGDDAGYLYCISKWGSIQWKFKTNGPIVGSPLLAANGMIIFGSADGNLYGIDQDGNQKWVAHTGVIMSSATSLDPVSVCVGTLSGNLYSVDTVSGHVNWTRPINDPILSAPSVTEDGTIYVSTTEQALWAYTKQGVRKWVLNLNPDDEDEGGIGAPAVAPDGTIYLTSHRKYLNAVRPDGTLKWRADAPGAMPGSVAIDWDGLVICVGDQLYATDPHGNRQWVINNGIPLVGSPALNEAGMICVVSASGQMVLMR